MDELQWRGGQNPPPEVVGGTTERRREESVFTDRLPRTASWIPAPPRVESVPYSGGFASGGPKRPPADTMVRRLAISVQDPAKSYLIKLNYLFSGTL